MVANYKFKTKACQKLFGEVFIGLIFCNKSPFLFFASYPEGRKRKADLLKILQNKFVILLHLNNV